MAQRLNLKSVISAGLSRSATVRGHGWSPEGFSVVYKGIARWRREGKQGALWLNYGNSSSAQQACSELVKYHHIQNVDVLGAIVVINAGVEHLEREVDEIKVHTHFLAKLRTALQAWENNGGNKPLVLEFLHPSEVKLAKQELKAYTTKKSEGAIAYGAKLLLPTILAQELRDKVV